MEQEGKQTASVGQGLHAKTVCNTLILVVNSFIGFPLHLAIPNLGKAAMFFVKELSRIWWLIERLIFPFLGGKYYF